MTLPTYAIKIYLSGPIEVAKQVIREHILEKPLCVTIDPTTFIYVGGEEAGYVVGLLNYPRFPMSPNELNVRADILAELLIKKTFQRSALVVKPEATKWITLESIAKNDKPMKQEYITDGFGNEWAKCGPDCDMEVVRPGKVQCSCIEFESQVETDLTNETQSKQNHE
jgi:hypothetical protein